MQALESDGCYGMRPAGGRGRAGAGPGRDDGTHAVAAPLDLLFPLHSDSIDPSPRAVARLRAPPLLYQSSVSSVMPSPIPNPRRTHRRRASALKLSSDTTASLPEYISPARYQSQHTSSTPQLHDPLDKPPDYPDSAEEADEDTDTDTATFFYVPQLPPLTSLPARPHTTSPRRAKRFVPTHKRRQSPLSGQSNSPYLDSLLARSVHALEMSNTLLQSSISTQTSLSTILASDSPSDSALEARARGLSSRIKDTWDAQATWADDLEELTKGVEGLFNDDNSDLGMRFRKSAARSRHQLEGSGSSGVSASLPSSSSMRAIRGSARRPSLLDLREPMSSETVPRLQYSQQSRANLVAPAPRAMTQYIESTDGADSMLFPSTIGLRSASSIHPTSEYRFPSEFASSSTTSLLSNASMTSLLLPPKLTDKQLEPSTPAYNMLASFVNRPPSSGSVTPSSSFTHSFMVRRRDSSTASNSTERGNYRSRRTSPSPSPHQTRDKNHRQDRYSIFKNAGPPSPVIITPRGRPQGTSPFEHRPMTPPAEESSSSSDGCVAKRTVQSLRKILDDLPAALPPKPSTPAQGLKPPAFQPRTPAPAPLAGTSTATASISRLYTKGTHSSSTRPRSPPRQSAMKRSPNASSASTPPLLSAANSTVSTPLPSTLMIPEFVGRVLSTGGGSGGSATSSGRSTPSKRISFAELPESYASTRPPSARFQEKAARKKKRASEKGKQRAGLAGEENGEPELGGWWAGWLGGGGGGGGGMGGIGTSLARHEEKMEDRMTRSWGGRLSSSFGGGLDEWAV